MSKAIAFTPLIGILFIASVLRLYNLGVVPNGFFCDEASFGVNALSVLRNGVDEQGVSFPIFFRSFGDYKEGAMLYSMIPSIWLFGLSEWSVRLPSALYGILNVWLVYLIGNAMVDRRLGLWSALAAATMPWLFHYDRVAFHSGPYITCLLLAIWCLISSTAGHPRRIVGFLVACVLCLYTYSPSKLFVPLLLATALCCYWTHLRTHWKHTAIGTLVVLPLLFPAIHAMQSGIFFARAQQLNLFNSTRSLTLLWQQWLMNYELQLLPSRLFILGEPSPIARHLIRGFHPLLVCTAPLFFWGIWRTIRGDNSRHSLFLLILFLCFPFGAMFTGSPFTLRSILGAPLSALLIGSGASDLTSEKHWLLRHWASRYLVILALLLAIAFETQSYFNRYNTLYPKISSGFYGWQSGAKGIMEFYKKHVSEYDDLYFPPEFNGPEVFLSFYDTEGMCKGRCKIGSVGNYNPTKRQLFSLTPQQLRLWATRNPSLHFTVLHSLVGPDGSVLFHIGSISKSIYPNQ